MYSQVYVCVWEGQQNRFIYENKYCPELIIAEAGWWVHKSFWLVSLYICMFELLYNKVLIPIYSHKALTNMTLCPLPTLISHLPVLFTHYTCRTQNTHVSTWGSLLLPRGLFLQIFSALNILLRLLILSKVNYNQHHVIFKSFIFLF